MRGVISSAVPGIEPGDVLIVPFPFAEREATKRRPALALSSADFIARTGTVVLAMITTRSHSPWPHDVPISNVRAAGLTAPCVVRWKIATRDVHLVLAKSGALAAEDRKSVRAALKQALGV